jgi:hypothetical protein
LIPAVWVFHSTQEGHWCFWSWCLKKFRNCSNLKHIPEWCQTCQHQQGDGHGVLGVEVGTC